MSDEPRRTRRTPSRTRARARAREDWRPAFLEALGACGVVAYAAKAAGVARSTVYEARDADEAFAKAWDDACEVAADVLEREAFRRAAEGTDRPVYQGGELVGAVREYSDTLLMFLLKARRPEKFRERQHVEHGGSVGVGITIERLIELAGED